MTADGASGLPRPARSAYNQPTNHGGNMANPKLSWSQAEAIVAPGRLHARGRIRWKPKRDDSLWVGGSIRVDSNDPKVSGLRLTVSHGYETEKTNFGLLYESLRIRSLCINISHGNHHTNTDEWIQTNHLHLWTDACADRFAVTPPGVVPVDIPGQLQYFLGVCGIMGVVEIDDLPGPQEVFDDL